ncbi:MAG: RidA family protein [Candidatus Zixiibacteriota bacterium]|nr:MAG: RidA family protein [candidate division Zixibacteria bacterium]
MKEIIRTSNAPAAIGPYSQAVRTSPGEIIFLSGQIPLDPQTMQLVGETAADQCRKVMENLSAVLSEAGAGFDRVVKTTIYLADMEEFAAVNEVYASYFKGDPPARVTVEVARLPKDVAVEIDAIAVI